MTTQPINWGAEAARQPVAYIQPTPEEVRQILAAVHLVNGLPVDLQRQVAEATKETRYFFDGAIRAQFGGTRHFNAIRCLNDPTTTAITPDMVRLPGENRVQLAGEEFFGLNRFMPNYADLADVQWWAVYRDGSWDLDRWNPQGEHLDTGVNGWGELVGSVMKVNGHVLTPQETVAFYRSIRMRNERGFLGAEARDAIDAAMRAVQEEGSLPSRYQNRLEVANDLGLLSDDGRTLTYTGLSMITPATARQRRERQLTETDPGTRRIIHPIIFQ